MIKWRGDQWQQTRDISSLIPSLKGCVRVKGKSSCRDKRFSNRQTVISHMPIISGAEDQLTAEPVPLYTHALINWLTNYMNI